MSVKLFRLGSFSKCHCLIYPRIYTGFCVFIFIIEEYMTSLERER